jgi:DNA-binding NarL/FixJ family response regulator
MTDKIRVFIVDDHDMVRKGLIVLLENFADIEVIGDTNDGQAAVDLCRQNPANVVLMDLIMPRLDGISATRLIRQACPDTHVIVLSRIRSRPGQSAT